MKSQFRSLVLVSTRTGRVDTSFPDTRNAEGNNAEPLSVVSDGHGGWFIAGQFACVGTLRVPGIAHLRPDGRLDMRWHARIPRAGSMPGMQGFVGVLRWGNTLLAVGGTTSKHPWFGALDARTGARRWLISNLHAGALAVGRTALLVGLSGGTRIKHRPLVALNPRTGAVLPWRAVLPRTFARKRVSISGLALAGQRLFVSAITREAITRDKPLPVFALDARTGRLTDWRAPQIKFADIVLAAHGLVFATNLSQTFVASARTGRPVAAFGTSPDFDHFAVVGDTLYANLGCPGPSQIQGQTRTLAAIDLRTLKVTPWAPVINPQAPKNHICLQALAADRSQVLLSAAGLLLPK